MQFCFVSTFTGRYIHVHIYSVYIPESHCSDVAVCAVVRSCLHSQASNYVAVVGHNCNHNSLMGGSTFV